MLCLNCNLEVQQMQRHLVSSLPQSLQNILAEWLNGQQLPLEGVICNACYISLNSRNSEELPNKYERILGHRMVCIGCGRSVSNRRHHEVLLKNPLIAVIRSWTVKNQELRNENHICHACWMRANRHLQQDSERVDSQQETLDPLIIPKSEPEIPAPPVLPDINLLVVKETVPTIVLPHYRRAAHTSRRCVFETCTNRSLHLIPTFIKIILLKDHKYYIPNACRVCEIHLYSDEWNSLPESSVHSNTFTAYQVENLIAVCNQTMKVFDFENVAEMPNHICYHWTGRTVLEFLALYNEVTSLHSIVKPKTALAIHLINQRTGDTNERIASLFQMPRSTLELYMNRARDCLTQHQ